MLGETHPSTLNALYNLGNMLVNIDEIDEADPYCVQALEGYTNLSESHMGTLHSLGLVSKLREKQGRIDDARALMQTALERRTETLGDDHWMTLEAIDRLKELDELETQPADGNDG